MPRAKRGFKARRRRNRILNQADDVFSIPEAPEYITPILSVVTLQLFAYHMAVLLGRDVDKPRNLAKSVTVP